MAFKSEVTQRIFEKSMSKALGGSKPSTGGGGSVTDLPTNPKTTRERMRPLVKKTPNRKKKEIV